MKKSHLIITLLILFGLAMFVRLTPHPANFTPVGAVALFAAVYLPKRWAVILPVSIMFLSDIFIGFYDLRLMLAVYGCFVLIGLVGLLVRRQKNLLTVLSATLGVSVLFFLVTNFAVWAFSSWYPHTINGLVLNYTLAVPFFRNTLLGNVFFVGVLFGAYELVRQNSKNLGELVRLKLYQLLLVRESINRSK